MIFRNLLDAIQPRNRVARAFVIRHAAAIPGKRDHIRNAGLCRQRNVRAKSLLDGRMILHPVQRLPNLSAARVSHGANQPVAARNLIFLRLQQVDAPQPNLRRILRQLIDRNMRIAPLANRLTNPSLAQPVQKLQNRRQGTGR